MIIPVGEGDHLDTGLILDTIPVTLYTPWSRPPVHLALEVLVVALGVLTFVHAWRARRAGDLLPLFTWLTIFIYGVAMEILSYNFVDNFVHAQFTVMFYHRKLPLYVTAVYPTLLYTGIATVRRFRFPVWAEGFAAGLFIVALDVPFDIVGPCEKWWSWSRTDAVLAYRWFGVPVTSYYWHLAFGGILAALTRAIAPHLRSPRQLVLAMPAALMTIVLGVVAFLPLHGLAKMGVSHGITVAFAWTVSIGVLLMAPKKHVAEPDWLLLAFPTTFALFHLAVAWRAVEGGGIGMVGLDIGFIATVVAAAHESTFARFRRKPVGE